MAEVRRLKYQELIEQQNLHIACPHRSCVQANIIGFRWTFAPVDNPDNFLPCELFNRKKNIPPRRNSMSEQDICNSFALSLFDSEANAYNRFHELPLRNRFLLGYTHLASGNLDGAGLMSKVNQSGHFTFFEFADTDLKSLFSIISELN